MRRPAGLSALCVGALFALTVSGCSSSQATKTLSQPSAPVHVLAGGCAGTVVTDAEPPIWAQGGFNNTKGSPWTLPWAMGKPGTAVAYLFAVQLVAGASPRLNGTNNKILWVTNDAPVGFVVDGHPLGESGPVVSVLGGPSIVDVPRAGCWTFTLSSRAGKPISTFNLDVLPAGTIPKAPPG